MWWFLPVLADDEPEGVLPGPSDTASTCCAGAAIVREALAPRIADLRACWEDAGSPAFREDRAWLRWVVHPNGSVDRVEVALGAGEALDACVSGVIAELEHREPGCLVVVRHPMPFPP